MCDRCRRHELIQQELEELSRGIAVVVLAYDQSLPQSAVLAAVAEAAPDRPQRRRLHTHLKVDPDALVAGSGVPPVVARLIERLKSAGAQTVRTPRCQRCDRETVLVQVVDGGRLCESCYRTGHTAICSGCGKSAPIKVRGPVGEPICAACDRRNESKWEICSRCGSSAPVIARKDGRVICGRCYTPPSLTCERCGRSGPIHSRRTGEDLCQHCYRHPERACGRCGKVGPITKRATKTTPDLCLSCYRPPDATCMVCGQEQTCHFVAKGRPTCERCILARRMRALLTSSDGEIPGWAEPVEPALLSTKNPQAMFVWLRRSEGARVLRGLVSETLPLTHEALDGLGPNKAVAHIRELLVASGALPWRDPYVARLEARVEVILGSLHDDDRRSVEAFVRWRLLPRFRARGGEGSLTSSSVENAARMVNETARFLKWLRVRDLHVQECGQADVDLWLSDGKLTRRLIRDFTRWMAKCGYMTGLSVPALSGSGYPTIAIDESVRWHTVKRLLHDDQLDVSDRVAGIFVLLYAQPVSRITKLTPKDVIQTEESLSITLGGDPVEIPEPLAELVRQLPQRRRRGSSAYLSDPHQWLFPGGRAGSPISRSHLSKRLADVGVEVRAARNGALLQLAGEVPPVVLADLLGISINNAVKWVRAASGQWSSYVACRTTAAASSDPVAHRVTGTAGT